jgi:hypothetical protein
VPTLKTNIAALEIDEYVFSLEVLLPLWEAVKRNALRRGLFNTIIGQMSVGD